MPDTSAELVYLVGFVIGSGVRMAYARRRGGGGIALRRGTVLDSVLVLLAGLGSLMPVVQLFSGWLGFADYAGPGWSVPVGAVVFAGALVLLWRSHANLGGQWSPRLEVQEGHVLVTGGVYGRVRHPMYAAHWLWGVAQVLLIHNWLAGPALLVTFLPLYLVRVPLEERMLAERFGAAYGSYAARTGRLIPRRRPGGRPRR